MKENDYRKYVIDDGKFIGKFEEMYQQCDDPWLQDSVLHKSNQIVLDILSGDKYNKILDIGCGKGRFTSLLYKNLNSPIDAIDISETAINIARESYPGINFIADDFLKTEQISNSYDLIIISQILWYVLDKIDVFFEKIKNISTQSAKVIFIQTYYNPDTQKYGRDIMTKAENILHRIPFEINNVIDVKNYKGGTWIDTESIIICRNSR